MKKRESKSVGKKIEKKKGTVKIEIIFAYVQFWEQGHEEQLMWPTVSG